ncbi:MAG TPA: DUF354 domain-containing protein [Candidatus Krumholzibacteria bacterium]|nr:DUF354 domain-containing protein [Candidatus Krumholzibacteria bacterium]
MRIWFDADNGPHVLIMNPLVRELRARGHEVLFTARDRTSTCELLDLYGHGYRRVGGEFGKGKLAKMGGTLKRAAALAAAMRGAGAQVSFGHGSRALPFASKLLGVPTVTMYDYEWVDPRIFNRLCRTILMPAVIDAERCREAGIDAARVTGYPGYKEELYLAERALEPKPVAADLGLTPERIHVLLRPPATSAHYHNPTAEKLLDRLLDQLSGRDDVELVYLARGKDQMAFLKPHDVRRVIVPQRVYDGPSLVAAMDLMMSGGGTMTREAAILGVPSYSFFQGREGRVDEALTGEGRLIMLHEDTDTAVAVRVEKRSGPVGVPDNGPLVRFIADAICGAAG